MASNKRGRDAENGRFTTVEKAQRERRTHTVETIPTRTPKAPPPPPAKRKP